MNTDILKFYSENGWQIFPVKAGDKTPLVKWADEATTEWNKITGWLDHYHAWGRFFAYPSLTIHSLMSIVISFH